MLPVGDVGFKTPEAINRNWGGGWFHAFSSSMILEARGGVATQPTEDAPLEHPAGLGPQQGTALPSLNELQGYVVSWGSGCRAGQGSSRSVSRFVY